MSPANNRYWIPMSQASADALERARWGAEERGEMYLQPKRYFRVVQIEYTAHGLGFFYGTTDWKSFRSMVLNTTDWKATLFRRDTDDILVSLTEMAEII